jgi:hypothetical protein
MHDKNKVEIIPDGETVVTMTDCDVAPVFLKPDDKLKEKAAEADLNQTIHGLVRSGLIDEREAVQMSGVLDNEKNIDSVIDKSDFAEEEKPTSGFKYRLSYCILFMIAATILFICFVEYMFITGEILNNFFNQIL